MKKQKANPKAICPQCGGAKGTGKKLCRVCSPNGSQTSSRMEQIILGLAKGKMLKEIAFDLGRSVKTIEFHWGKAKAKYGFQSYIDAVLYALAHDMVELKQVVRRRGS